KVELPAAGRPDVTLAKKSEVWVTEVDDSFAAHLADRLTLLGHNARLVSLQQLNHLKPEAPLAGLVIVAPKNADDQFLFNAFRILQIAAPGLRNAAKAGGSLFATVSRLDGAFGLSPQSLAGNGLCGGLAGLTKTACHEWPEVHCKAIDLTD